MATSSDRGHATKTHAQRCEIVEKVLWNGKEAARMQTLRRDAKQAARALLRHFLTEVAASTKAFRMRLLARGRTPSL
eukprot:365542-Chlamydomonas_euryale.AAC.20